MLQDKPVFYGLLQRHGDPGDVCEEDSESEKDRNGWLFLGAEFYFIYFKNVNVDP